MPLLLSHVREAYDHSLGAPIRDTPFDQGFLMDRVKVDLQNCYGIKSLQRELDFRKTRAYALYAPNGVMKSSLAQTFKDAAEGKASSDRIFPSRKTERKILDETGAEISGERILVVLPYDGQMGVTEKTSTLLVDATLKAEYESLLQKTALAQEALLAAVRAQASSKADFAIEISSSVMRTNNEIENALVRLKREVDEQKDIPFGSVKYDVVFNDKVVAALGTRNLKTAIEEYVRVYNKLLEGSTYFKKGIFDYYNGAQIAKSLADNGFFTARHTVSLNAEGGSKQITTQQELEDIIESEKQAILSDKVLRKSFEEVARQLQRNTELRDFLRYLQANEFLLSHMSNPERFQQDVLKSYLKANQELYSEWMDRRD